MRLSSGVARGDRIGLLGDSDDALLKALARYHYLSAQQACRLLYSPGSLTYSQSKLKRLWEWGYCERLFLPRASQHGSAPGVYALSNRGYRYLASHGLVDEGRYGRPPGRRHWSYLFLKHTLMVNDVLITVELLEHQLPRVAVAKMLHELDLKRTPLRLTVNGEKLSVVPDGYVELQIDRRYQQCIALEIDRGTEGPKRWQSKVRGWIAASQGPYQQRFGTESLTVIVIALPDVARLDHLLRWTEEELEEAQARNSADLFRFASLSEEMLRPEVMFLGPGQWYCPFEPDPVALLEEVS